MILYYILAPLAWLVFLTRPPRPRRWRTRKKIGNEGLHHCLPQPFPLIRPGRRHQHRFWGQRMTVFAKKELPDKPVCRGSSGALGSSSPWHRCNEEVGVIDEHHAKRSGVAHCHSKPQRVRGE